MSRRTVISVRGLGKQYDIGETFSSTTFRDAIASGARRLMRRPAAIGKAKPSGEFWALKDVSFDVPEGEVLGIIGANGAGKSTLLKILSGITEPTEGEVRTRGRVAALLEVGTGFHPELSGRENVFMNGAILGMTQAEMRRLFDEIVAFAGVEAFIDTPVKRYSSGMLMRLGFAVAAHLQPEILVVDEVLAVGDAEFQRRCVGKMEDVARSGRTVLFVSHNLAAVEVLCPQSVFLVGGRVESLGSTRDIVAVYQAACVERSEAIVSLSDHSGRYKKRIPLMVRATLSDARGTPKATFSPRETIVVSVDYRAHNRPFSPVLGVMIKTPGRVPILGLDNSIAGGHVFPSCREAGRISCTIPDLPLIPGRYSIDLYLGDPYGRIDSIRDAVAFDVTLEDAYGSGRLPEASQHGPVLWDATWNWQRASE